jgi:hypothetical protein
MIVLLTTLVVAKGINRIGTADAEDRETRAKSVRSSRLDGVLPSKWTRPAAPFCDDD